MVESLPFEPSQEPIPAPNPNKAIRDYIQTDQAAVGWKYADKARDFYDYSKIIAYSLFSPRDDVQARMPDFLIAIDNLPVNVLGAFHLVKDGLGLDDKITMNQRYAGEHIWGQLETLTHEMTHVYVNKVLGHKDTHNYHTKEFVEIMADIGIPVKLGEGYHIAPPSGQYVRLMEWLSVPRPPAVKDAGDAGDFILPPGFKNWFDADRGGRKGQSTLLKYVADVCLRPKTCNFRAGLSDLHVGCRVDQCSGVFRAVES